MKNSVQFNRKFLAINWGKVGENLLSSFWQILLTTLIFYLIAHFGKKIINRYLSHPKSKFKNKRTKTLTALINSIFQYTVIFFYLSGILSIIGIPVGTLLASAGIFSLALGMGAQGFVSDLVNGFFILSEDQFDVGDTVQINSQLGTVIQLGLRTTRLKGIDGSIIYIPNRNITTVRNLAHNAISLTITLELDPNNDFTNVTKIINKVNANIHPAAKSLISGPKVIGITNQNGQIVTYTITFKVRPDKQGAIKHLYLSNYIQALQANSIKFARNSTSITTKTV